jgi:hypothetical protein
MQFDPVPARHLDVQQTTSNVKRMQRSRCEGIRGVGLKDSAISDSANALCTYSRSMICNRRSDDS